MEPDRRYYNEVPFVRGNQNGGPVYEKELVSGEKETYLWGYTKDHSQYLVARIAGSNYNWVGSNRGKYINEEFNALNDSVIRWTVSNEIAEFGNFSLYYPYASYYTGRELAKTIVTDEHGKQVITFTNREGLVLLNKVQLDADPDNGSGSGYNGWLSTYYIYDDFNRIRCIIQPAGVAELSKNGWQLNSNILNEQCYRFEYDGRNRVIAKKVRAEERFIWYMTDRID